MDLTDKRLGLIKRGLNASNPFPSYTKLVHKFDCFRINEILIDGTERLSVRLKVKSIELKPQSLQLKQLISDLIILNETLDRD